MVSISSGPAIVQIRLPVFRSVVIGEKVALQIVGSLAGPVDGAYIGLNGYTFDVEEAQDFAPTITEDNIIIESPGAPGKSAYSSWLDAENEGTEADFLTSLRGMSATSDQVAASVAAFMLANGSDYAGPPGTTLWGGIDDRPELFPPSTHSHTWDSVTGKPSTFAPSAHSHVGLCKYARRNLSTNSSGIWSQNLGAGVFDAEPSISVSPRSPLLMHSHSVSGNSVSGYVVTVTFTQLRASLTVLGALTVAIANPVQFDIQAFEVTA